MKLNLEQIHWLAHASFRIEVGDLNIYIDPWQLGENPPPADIILITHDHGDHCSPEDIAKIQTEETVIVTVDACVSKLSGEIKIIQPGDKLSVQGIPIEVVPAYNLTKFRTPGNPFHPKESGYVGFVVTVDGQRIYHTGDADAVAGFQRFYDFVGYGGGDFFDILGHVSLLLYLNHNSTYFY